MQSSENSLSVGGVMGYSFLLDLWFDGSCFQVSKKVKLIENSAPVPASCTLSNTLG